jgi:type IV pilus assembly protein PilE
MRGATGAAIGPRGQGFTLIELMIVVLIIGVLAAIAWPQYTQYVLDSNRSTCAAKLVELSNHMERYFTENQSYRDSSNNAPDVTDFLSSDSCPPDTSNPAYTLSIATNSDTEYTLTATAQGRQTSDDCGDLSLDETGDKGATGGTVNQCW